MLSIARPTRKTESTLAAFTRSDAGGGEETGKFSICRATRRGGLPPGQRNKGLAKEQFPIVVAHHRTPAGA
jgi:hypothetical protein